MKAHEQQLFLLALTQIKMRSPFYWVQSLWDGLQTRILGILALEIKFSRQITSCPRQLFPPQKFWMTQCFLQVSSSPLSTQQLQDLAEPPTKKGQSICSAPAVPTYSSLLAHPCDLSTICCTYTEVLHNVALHPAFWEKPTCFATERNKFCLLDWCHCTQTDGSFQYWGWWFCKS